MMKQMGHATPGFTLSVYAQAMDWSEGEREQLRALIEAANGQGRARGRRTNPVEDGREAV